MPGAEGLWLAVVVQALEDLHRHRLSIGSLRGRLSISSARQWFQSREGGIGSIAWVCDILGLEVELVRRLALGAVAPSSLATPDIMSEVKSFLAP